MKTKTSDTGISKHAEEKANANLKEAPPPVGNLYARDLSLINFRRPDPWETRTPDPSRPKPYKSWGEMTEDERVSKLVRMCLPDEIEGLPPPKVGTKEAKGVSNETGDTPMVALGPQRPAMVQDLLVNANYCLANGDYDGAYSFLDEAWRALPKEVRAGFRVRPSDLHRSRLADGANYLFEKFDIYDKWGTHVTNHLFKNGEYGEFEKAGFWERRAVAIADLTCDELIRALWDEMQRKGYDMPVSNRYTLQDSIRASVEFDEARKEEQASDEDGQ